MSSIREALPHSERLEAQLRHAHLVVFNLDGDDGHPVLAGEQNIDAVAQPVFQAIVARAACGPSVGYNADISLDIAAARCRQFISHLRRRTPARALVTCSITQKVA